MLRLPCKLAMALLLLVSSLSSSHAAGCDWNRRHDLMKKVLYREALPTQASQAKVAATVFVRLATWGYGNLCQAMVAPSQYVYRLEGRIGQAKLALANSNTSIFLREHEQGIHTTQGHIFDDFKRRNIDSFHAASNDNGLKENVFYSSRSRKKRL